MWNRRGFLGTVAAAAFYAMLPSDPFQRTILPYRMTFFGQGFEFQAPGVAKIEKVENGFRFIAEPLDIHQAGTVSGVTLHTEDGKFLASSKFSADACVISGDTLKVNYTLSVDGRKVDTPEQLVELYLSRPDLVQNDRTSYQNCRLGNLTTARL